MKRVGYISTAVLSLTLIAAVPAFAQEEQHDQQQEQKAKPDQNEKQTQPDKSARQEEKPATRQEENAKPEEQNAKQEDKNAQQNQHAAGNRIPADKFKANFGQQHTFHVSQADYSNHRFQYGGYSFGFVDAWPSNWLYTQNVYVVEISGMYYLCNPMYPGVNIALSFSM